jgi:hypothetical protein
MVAGSRLSAVRSRFRRDKLERCLIIVSVAGRSSQSAKARPCKEAGGLVLDARADLQGAEAARLRILRTDSRLCLDAGDSYGE